MITMPPCMYIMTVLSCVIETQYLEWIAIWRENEQIWTSKLIFGMYMYINSLCDERFTQLYNELYTHAYFYLFRLIFSFTYLNVNPLYTLNIFVGRFTTLCNWSDRLLFVLLLSKKTKTSRQTKNKTTITLLKNNFKKTLEYTVVRR